jgi:hypothetical protein
LFIPIPNHVAETCFSKADFRACSDSTACMHAGNGHETSQRVYHGGRPLRHRHRAVGSRTAAHCRRGGRPLPLRRQRLHTEVEGQTMARRRVLQRLGWIVVSVPMAVWFKLPDRSAKEGWLWQQLLRATRAGAIAASDLRRAAPRSPSSTYGAPKGARSSLSYAPATSACMSCMHDMQDRTCSSLYHVHNLHKTSLLNFDGVAHTARPLTAAHRDEPV